MPNAAPWTGDGPAAARTPEFNTLLNFVRKSLFYKGAFVDLGVPRGKTGSFVSAKSRPIRFHACPSDRKLNEIGVIEAVGLASGPQRGGWLVNGAGKSSRGGAWQHSLLSDGEHANVEIPDFVQIFRIPELFCRLGVPMLKSGGYIYALIQGVLLFLLFVRSSS